MKIKLWAIAKCGTILEKFPPIFTVISVLFGFCFVKTIMPSKSAPQNRSQISKAWNDTVTASGEFRGKFQDWVKTG